MKMDRGWVWCMLLLSSLAVVAVFAHEKRVDVSDVDEDLDREGTKVLEEEEEQDEATVMDEEDSDEADDKGRRAEVDANVSFQVWEEITACVRDRKDICKALLVTVFLFSR